MADERPTIMTGLFRDRDSAERAYGKLVDRGYGRDDVSLLMSDETRKRHFTNPDRFPVHRAGRVLVPAAPITGHRSDLPGKITAQMTENISVRRGAARC